jgi:hypothetical protein
MIFVIVVVKAFDLIGGHAPSCETAEDPRARI